MKLPDKVYDVFKWLSCVALDALGLLYKTLAEIWQLPYGEKVYNTCVAVSICIGVLIGVSTYQFNKENAVFIEPKNIEPKENGGEM